MHVHYSILSWHSTYSRIMEINKPALLALLLFQNTFLALSIKASKNADVQYISSTVVFLNELLKFVVCTIFYLWEKDSVKEPEQDSSLAQSTPSNSSDQPESKFRVFFKKLVLRENLLFVVPCVIYAIQNNIVFIALGMIDAALYQVLANLKIITTGIFSVVMLRKSLHRLQWMALVLLATGEALAETSAHGKIDESKHNNRFAGVLLMMVFATLSGFAGVFMEKMFKKKNQMSFCMRSMMLYFWGSVVNGLIVLVQDGTKVVEQGFFYGYGLMTMVVLFLLAFGGLLVSVVITQFDNITKVYVTCLSIFTTSVFSYYLFDFQYNLNFMLSAIVVSISILVYNDPVTLVVTTN